MKQFAECICGVKRKLINEKWKYKVTFEINDSIEDLEMDEEKYKNLMKFRDPLNSISVYDLFQEKTHSYYNTDKVSSKYNQLNNEESADKIPRAIIHHRKMKNSKMKKVQGKGNKIKIPIIDSQESEQNNTFATISDYQIGKKTEINYFYCHHCKQRKPAEFSMQCKSSYTENKYCQRPFKSFTVNGTTVIRKHKSLMIKNYDGDTKEFTELLNKLENKNLCQRYFCYFCLKGNYDTLAENIKDNYTWLCPYCTGACYCTRCMRNEKILQLLAYYFSIDGNIIYLQSQLTKMDPIIDELLFSNFLLNNVYMIIYDKNLTPAQMVNNFINFNDEKYEQEIEEKEEEINKYKEYIKKLNKKKEEIHNEFISFCKDKYKTKNEYYLINSRPDNDIYGDVNITINNLNLEENKNDNDFENESKGNGPQQDNQIKKNGVQQNIIYDESVINELINKNKNEGIKTRAKEKVIYFGKNSRNRKKIRKIIRKKKPLVLRRTNKYYIDKK